MRTKRDTANASEYHFRQTSDGELTMMDDWKQIKRRWFGIRVLYVADSAPQTNNTAKRSEG